MQFGILTGIMTKEELYFRFDINWVDRMNSRLIGKKNKYLKHEYLRNSIDLEYKECKSCKIRTQFTCVVCGFCWSCHWKVEQLAKIPKYLLEDVINE
jgi:hypothetical protein